MIRVLVLEDDVGLSQSLRRYLAMEGFEVTMTARLSEASEALSSHRFNVLVLDWMLPDGQGIDLLKSLRAKSDHTPVLLLTARTDVVDCVLGLELGADDYLTKPFEPRELVARLRARTRAQQRQAPADASDRRSCRGMTLDIVTREVWFNEEAVSLTRMEFELLRTFLENPDKVFSREELLNQVWGFEHFPTTRTVDTHVLQLRQKLDPEAFQTVRGVGYRLKSSAE